jgi:hypothetical protein
MELVEQSFTGSAVPAEVLDRHDDDIVGARAAQFLDQCRESFCVGPGFMEHGSQLESVRVGVARETFVPHLRVIVDQIQPKLPVKQRAKLR